MLPCMLSATLTCRSNGNLHLHLQGKKRRPGALEVDFPHDDGRVVVKKQKVTIFISALPVTEQLKKPNLEKCALPVNLRNTSNIELECSEKSYSQKHSVSETEKAMSPAPESAFPTTKTIHPLHSHLVPKLSNQRASISSENPEINNLRVQNSVGVFNAMKVRKQALISGDGDHY